LGLLLALLAAWLLVVDRLDLSSLAQLTVPPAVGVVPGEGFGELLPLPFALLAGRRDPKVRFCFRFDAIVPL
jgi:hypothetical protein